MSKSIKINFKLGKISYLFTVFALSLLVISPIIFTGCKTGKIEEVIKNTPVSETAVESSV